jgi:hypothetical protein
MKKVLRLGLVCLIAASTLAPATAAPVCLWTYMIDRTKVIDARTLDFRMRNGVVYRNALRTECQGLKFHGFVYVTHFDDICDNMQSIRVLESGEVCLLGAFTKLPPAPAGKI